jgi:hypothetical protein
MEEIMRGFREGSRCALFIVPLVLAALATPLRGSAQEHRLGTDAAVYNLAGSVEIVPGSGGEVVVQVTRGGSDAGRLELSVMEVDGREALIIRYPDDQVIYPEMGRGSNTQIRVRDDGTFFGGRSSGGDQIRISGSGRGMEAWADLRIAVPRGSDFALFLAVGETRMQDVDGDLLIDTGAGPVHARGGAGELEVDTGSGEVTVEGFDGDLTVDTGSGGVEISDVRGSEVTVDTGSGSVRGSGISSAVLEVDTGSGEIDLSGVAAAEITLDTGSGSVAVELLEDVDMMEVDTGSGAVTVRVPVSLGARVDLDTGGGGIDVDVPLEIQSAKRDHVRGVLGDGRGTIVIDTGSGGIRLIGG